MGSPWSSFWHSLTSGESSDSAESQGERRSAARVATDVPVTIRWEENGSRLLSAVAHVRDVSERGMSVTCQKAFSRGQTVWIMRKSAPALKAVVRHIENEQGAYRVGLSIVVNERRRADRFPSEGEGVLTWAGDLGQQIECPAQVRDLSESGMQIEVPIEAPIGVIARLIGERVVCVGTTRYCKRGPSGFLVGLQFVQRPSSKTYRPAELRLT